MKTIQIRPLSLALTLVIAPALGAQGLSYDMKTTGSMVDPRSGAATTRTFMAAHGQFANGVSRIDITESMSPGGLMGTGTYTITNAAKGTTTIVDPAKRTYMELNPAELAKTAAGLQQSLGGLAKTEISDISVNVEDLGAGEPIEGYSTVKYRVTESYTMNMTVMGRSNRSTTHTTSELWVAPQLDGIMNPTARPAAADPTGPMAELTTQLMKAYAKVKKGVMLKRVAVMESESNGKPRSTTMTMTIENVKRASISPSAFEVPSGYSKSASLTDAIAPLGAITDSLNAARARAKKSGAPPSAEDAADSTSPSAKQAALDAAKDATKDEAKAKVNKAIGRIFGRPRE
ncbi:MAG: DUF4412 domain-containing protein [Gemmatimonadota bacterium]|nr:DUF4412 domain-containing protein [Gemmatimonadota bacterium]